MKKNVLITGGTGFVGKNLTNLLVSAGYSVSIVTRSVQVNTPDVSYYELNVSEKKIDKQAVLNADYIVHLAGENIAEKRWTTKRKAAIITSRVLPVELMFSILDKNDIKTKAFISASAVGIYGADNRDEICNEETPVADDFLGVTCQKWEQAADQIENLGIRTVKIRTGLVLGKNEGFLKNLVPVFKNRMGAALGSGKQYMPWIHIEDLCKMYLEAIENSELSGPYNAAINDGTTNKIFSQALSRIFSYSLWLPNVPAFLIRLGMGEMAKIVLTGKRISSDKISNTGFKFEFTDLKKALSNCIGK